MRYKETSYVIGSGLGALNGIESQGSHIVLGSWSLSSTFCRSTTGPTWCWHNLKECRRQSKVLWRDNMASFQEVLTSSGGGSIVSVQRTH